MEGTPKSASDNLPTIHQLKQLSLSLRDVNKVLSNQLGQEKDLKGLNVLKDLNVLK